MDPSSNSGSPDPYSILGLKPGATFDEIQKADLKVTGVTVAPDGLSADLKVTGLRELFVHEISAPGVRSTTEQPLLHDTGWYTLNQIPGS